MISKSFFLCVAGAGAVLAESGIPVTLEALALDARERRSTDIEGSGTVDQCADGTHTCDANAVCTDKTGGFDCACVSGYYGDGETCTLKETVNVEMAMPLTEPYSDDLADSSSAAHQALAATVVDQTMASIEQSAETYSCDAHVNGVTFAPTAEGRRRRSGATGTTATVDISFTTNGDQTESGDLSSNVSGDVSSNVQDAISSGAIALVDPASTVAVSATLQDKWTIVTDAISCLDNSLCGVGGACASICGTNGYCCSGSPPIPGLNGDCPADAVAFLNAADSSQTIHQCIVQDINECIESTPCHALATCSNTVGSYECACNSGYDGDGVTTCDNINECTAGTSACEFGHCADIDGSYQCNCFNGFTSSADPFKCVDVDECTIGGTICDKNAMCINTLGSYACMCKAGFVGNGLKCNNKSIFWFFG